MILHRAVLAVLTVGATCAGLASPAVALGASGGPAAAPAGFANTANKPRATVAGTAVAGGSGRVLVSLRSDANRVLLKWRTADGKSWATVLRISAGKGAGYLPAGSRRISAKALATSTHRASLRVALSVPDVPASVTGLKASAVSPTSATLAWTNPADPGFTGVIVRRSKGSTPPTKPTGGNPVALPSPKVAQLADTALTAGTTYSYSVFAMSASGKAAPPATVTVTLPVPAALPATSVALPANSGQGRRIVWSPSRNRVWAVEAGEAVARTFPVTDNNELTPPGNYQVLRRNPMSYTSPEYGQLTLPYFLGFFKRCASCAYIGFHQIPLDVRGIPIQPESTLGSPLHSSHGCVRTSQVDAKFLFEWAELGTSVVVVP